MTTFVSVGILVLSMLISCFLMLTPNIFANFLHYASGKYSRQKANDLTLFFILGAETMAVLLLFLTATIVWALPLTIINLDNPLLAWIFAGIFVATSFAIFFIYFRKNGQLFIPRQTAAEFINKPKTVKNRSDAFVFGLISSIPELPFTIPLYFASVLAISNISLSPFPCAKLIIIYAIIIVCPLFVIRILFKYGHNLADYLRFHHKNRQFFRFFISSLYLLLALILVIFGGINS